MILEATLFGDFEYGDETLRHTFATRNYIWWYLAPLAIREILFGKWRLRTLIGLFVLGLIGTAAYTVEWYDMTFLCAFAFCARDLDFKQFAKIVFVFGALYLAAMFVASASGILPDSISDLGDATGQHRHYLGFRHPNGSGLLVFAMVIAGVYSQGKRFSIPQAFALAILVIAVFILNGGRTMLIASILTLILGLIAAKWTAPGWFVKSGRITLALVPVISIAGALLFALYYVPGTPWMEQLNEFLSGRPFVSYKAVRDCGLHMWPSIVDLPTHREIGITGDGRLIEVTAPIPVDCHYVTYALRMGLVLTGVYAVLLAVLGFKSWTPENPQLAIIVFAMFLYMFMEIPAFLPCRNPMSLVLGIVFASAGADLLKAKRRRRVEGPDEDAPPEGDLEGEPVSGGPAKSLESAKKAD